MEEIRKIPPVTRTLLGSTLAVTLPVTLAIKPAFTFALYWPLVYRNWQFYRIYTSFFFGGSGLSLLFDCFVLYRNSSDLELNHFARRTADYVWCLLVMAAVILGTNQPLGSMIHFNQLQMALTYVWSRANPHSVVSFFGMVNVPSRFLPYTYLALHLLQGGPGAAVQSGTGLLAGYAYWLIAEVLPARGRGGRSYLPTPSLLKRLLPDSQDPSMQGQNMGDRQGRRTAGGYAWNARVGGQNANRLGDESTPSRTSSAPTSIASALGAGTRTTLNRINPFAGRSSSSSATPRGAPSREDILAAAERRINANKTSSIVGRNAAEKSSPTIRRAGNETAGSTAISSPTPNSASNLRKTAAGTGQSSMFTFGQLSNSTAADVESNEEDHSSSGGAVAEQRQPSQKGKQRRTDSDPGTATHTSPTHSWGSAGRRLGE